MAEYVPSIGIETHVQFSTATKLFAAVSNDARDAPPNSVVSPICFGLPGVLPVLNEKAVEYAIRAGLVLNGSIAKRTKFDRKHYFYPDLPKGYQITQYDEPIIHDGYVEVPVGSKTIKVRIERAHLEEDAGKSIHPPGADYSLVDLNRAGTPLLEIVSAPDMHSPAEARAYARELYLLMKYAGVSDVDLYQGNVRFDVNVSISPDGRKLGTRSETKNLNSFRAVERAVAFEIKRQTELLDIGQKVVQETRGWDDAKQKTFSQRSKEEAEDYRYFPEPDIPPLHIETSAVDKVRQVLPTMPAAIRQDLLAMGLDLGHVETLLEYPSYIDLIHKVKHLATKDSALFAANLIINVWLREENSAAEGLKVSAEQFVDIASMVGDGQLSSTTAKTLLLALQKSELEQSAADLAREMSLIQVSDEGELEKFVDMAIADNPLAADDVKKGEERAVGFLVGQVMKLSKGQANPQLVSKLLSSKLQKAK